MIGKTIRCVATIALVALVLPASAVTLTFEDLSLAPASYDLMPTPYNGFTFTGWYYGPDTVYTPSSGTIDLFTDYADPSNPGAYVITDNNSVSAATPFHFDGATFSGYSGVTFALYLGGSLVHTSASILDAAGPGPYLPTVLASGYSGVVDTVKVSGVQGYYSMDDFTYHAAATVPEPEIYALLVGGLGFVAFAVRRRKTLQGS